MDKEKQPKLETGVTELFLEALQSMSTEELKAEIVRLQVQNAENEAYKLSDKYLGAKEEFDYAKDTWDVVAGPVKEVTTAIKNRTKRVIDRLKDKGAV